MSGKKTYTVPVLLLVITVLAVLIVALYSKWLLDDQSSKTDRGMQLASEYNGCLTMASLLNEEVGNLAQSADAAERLPIKQRLGQAQGLSGECVNVLYKSALLNGQTKEQAAEAASGPLRTLWTKLEPIGNHDGPLTSNEQNILKLVQEAGAELEQTLQAYTVPTSGDRYRQMAAGDEWPDSAQKALEQLRQLADALK